MTWHWLAETRYRGLVARSDVARAELRAGRPQHTKNFERAIEYYRAIAIADTINPFVRKYPTL